MKSGLPTVLDRIGRFGSLDLAEARICAPSPPSTSFLFDSSLHINKAHQRHACPHHTRLLIHRSSRAKKTSLLNHRHAQRKRQKKMVDTSQERIYDEIEIEDMTYDPVTQLYTYPCPCGDRFEINIEDLRDGEEIAVCPSCSLMIRVIYEVEDLPAAAAAVV